MKTIKTQDGLPYLTRLIRYTKAINRFLEYFVALQMRRLLPEVKLCPLEQLMQSVRLAKRIRAHCSQ